ncbi:MAG: phosphate ABC transporter substrate-binding protein [Spirochaetae bacterium HGW-Spirochaetae-1]|jgi:phosphate transport system substrate-binding protein|nr:MAG: phosphate ABC transporter substrate-binding protein [Spirochaetae bacterium HGW-Spirochaetae-1]
MKSKFSKIITVIAVITIAPVFFFGCSKNSGGKIVIKGSTTVLPITQKAAEEYRKTNKISISIEGSGSGNGIKAIIDGTCDIGNSSREMKEKELKSARENGVKVKEITVAYDMIIPVVHPSNPVKTLTTDQLKAIYDGSIKNWKEVGGKDATIVVISRDTSSGTYEVWESKIMNKTDVRKDALLQASNGAVASSIAGNPKAIGYIGYGYLSDGMNSVMVNNVEGTIENGKSGKFPISRKLYMYINEAKISKEAMDFVNYLIGADGQKLVKEAGFIPLM